MLETCGFNGKDRPTMKKCPYCAEEIQDKARVCKHCKRKQPVKHNFAILIWALVGFALLRLITGAASPESSPTTRTSIPTYTPIHNPTNVSIFESPTQRPVSLNACVTNETIRIRRGPGTQYEAIGGMVSGTCMTILGRNQDSSWVYMTSDDNKSGWVNAPLLTIEGNLNHVSAKTDSAITNSANPTLTNSQRQSLAQTYVAAKNTAISATNTPRPVVIQPTAQNNNCSPAYPGVCIPPAPPDLDCKDVRFKRFKVLPPDPHNFDADGDGIGCES